MSDDCEGTLYNVEVETYGGGHIEWRLNDQSGEWEEPPTNKPTNADESWYEDQRGLRGKAPITPTRAIYILRDWKLSSGEETRILLQRADPGQGLSKTGRWDRPNAKAEWRQTYPVVDSNGGSWVGSVEAPTNSQVIETDTMDLDSEAGTNVTDVEQAKKLRAGWLDIIASRHRGLRGPTL